MRNVAGLSVAAALVLAQAAPAFGRQSISVGREVPVTPADLRVQFANNSPQIVQSPEQPDLLAMAVRLDGPDFGCALQVSGNGGRGWIGVIPVPRLPEGAEKCYAPEVAFGPDGTLYYLFVGLRTAGNIPMGVFLATSGDFGQTFSEPRQILGPRHYMVRMAIDTERGERGRIHLVWLRAHSDPPLGGLGPPPNPIMAAFSDDGGRTFSQPAQVSDRRRRLVVAPALAVGRDGAVHVLYYDLKDDLRDYQGLQGPAWEGKWELVMASSRDAGGIFEGGAVVDDAIVPPERILLIFTMAPASLAVDGSGRVFAAWHDGRNGDWDFFLRRSGNGGRSWARRVRVNDDRRGNGRHQYLPRISAGANGRIDAIFYDRRDDPRNLRNNVYYAYSSDGGRTFERNLRVTRKSSSSAIGQRYQLPSQTGLVEIGSRLGLLSSSSGALAAWTDTRNSAGGLAQDIFAAEIHHAEGEPGPQPVRRILTGVVAAVFAGGALGLFVARRRRGGGLAAVALLAVVSCSPGPQALPPPPEQVTVTMTEYRFGHPAQLPAGRTVFRVKNSGTVAHQATLLSLPQGFPPIREQLAGAVRRPVPTVALVHAVQPGGEETFAVDLAPGRYAFVCYVEESPGVQHADKGMASEIRVSRTT